VTLSPETLRLYRAWTEDESYAHLVAFANAVSRDIADGPSARCDACDRADFSGYRRPIPANPYPS
jgi:hypothetical protein